MTELTQKKSREAESLRGTTLVTAKNFQTSCYMFTLSWQEVKGDYAFNDH
jgi:hypothetical protein